LVDLLRRRNISRGDESCFNQSLETREGAATDEEDIRGVDLRGGEGVRCVEIV
jgi:hypothetical protein